MIKFLYTNSFDSATVTSLNVATGYSAANVQDRLLKKTYRSTGLTSQWLKFDLGSTKTIDMFTFFYNNLTSGATVKLYGHATDLGLTELAWAGASYVGTITSFDARAGYIAPTGAYRWYLLAITDASNTDGYIQIGRVCGGTAVSPTENFAEDFQESIIDGSDQSWTIGSHVYSIQRERYTTFDFSFRDISNANQVLLRTLYAAVYKTEPFVIAFDASVEPYRWTRYGVLTTDLQFSYTANARANCSLGFRELR